MFVTRDTLRVTMPLVTRNVPRISYLQIYKLKMIFQFYFLLIKKVNHRQDLHFRLQKEEQKQEEQIAMNFVAHQLVMLPME